MSRPRDERQKDLFQPALDRIIDMGHPLVRLAGEMELGFLEQRFASVCTTGPGQPPLPGRLIAGLFIVKHMHSLSDEVLCSRWLDNPYYQYFCGEQAFLLTRWRQLLGKKHLAALLQESLSVAHKTGAIGTKDLERVAVDTTVQPRAIAHPDRCASHVPSDREARGLGRPRSRHAQRGEHN
jgi:IS5 family transposase